MVLALVSHVLQLHSMMVVIVLSFRLLGGYGVDCQVAGLAVSETVFVDVNEVSAVPAFADVVVVHFGFLSVGHN